MTDPLDPLTAAEIRAATEAVRSDPRLHAQVRFVFVALREPTPAAFAAWQRDPSALPPRVARATVLDRQTRFTYHADVPLDPPGPVHLHHIPGVQPAVMRDESVRAEDAVRADPRWQQALRRRGVEDFSRAMIDHMPAGYQGPDQDPSRRLGLALTWLRGLDQSPHGYEDNGYARPVEGVVAHLDLDTMEVLAVEDIDGPPIPHRPGNYSPEAIADPENYPHFPQGPRTDLRPLDITQPEGSSLDLNGHHLTWQKWSMRIGFNGREGLTLHAIGYEDGGRTRSIVHRASLSEMFVPYGDPGVTHYRKQLFDEGEAGIGRCVNSLALGCDCLGDITYLDVAYNDSNGDPVTVERGICIHEEDYGTLWKHTALRTGYTEVRRSRRLVVSSISTVGNYEYGFFWYFYADGTIQHEVKLNGILSTGAFDEAGPLPAYGNAVAPGVYGPNHQHWFNVRLHMAVDDGPHELFEVESVADSSPDNHFGNAWRAHARSLVSEQQAQRDINIATARYWKVVNPRVVNGLGRPVAYKLVPGENVHHMYQPDALGLKRAAFIAHHLWATPFHEDELFAAGEFPNQHPGGAGLPEWTAADRKLEGDDVVLWYSFGAHHEARTEDWPVMPVHYIGFHLKPSGFFDGNPALDLPRPHKAHCERT